MMKKLFKSNHCIIYICLIAFSSNIFANEKFEIKPKVDLTLRYNQKDIKYTTLGENINNQKDMKFSNSALGGDLGFDIKSNGFDFIIQGSGVRRISNISDNVLKTDRTYFDNDRNDFFYLSNIYIKKSFENSNIKIGRQKYNNELVNKNKKLISNQYEGIYLDYQKDNFKINLLYFNKIASSTISNVVPFNHNYGVLGYGKGYKVGEFVSLSEHISNKDYDTKGAVIIDSTYGDLDKSINVQNLYVDNFFNTLNLIGKIKFTYDQLNIITKAGYIKQFNVGENYFAKDYADKKIDAQIYQALFRLQYKNYFGSITYSHTPYDKNSVLNGTIISPFSNKIAWIKGPQTAHAFISDTDSRQFLLGSVFNLFKKKMVLVYADIDYDIGSNNGLIYKSLNTKEKYLHLKLFMSKNLNVTFQYSEAKNTDLLVKSNNNIRTFINYKF